MLYNFFLAFILLFGQAQAQVFLPSLAAPVSTKRNLSLEYQVFSTHAGTGSTTQYIACPTTKAEFDKLFDTSFSNTSLFSSGKSNNMTLLDWDNYTDLTSAGISIPNAGDYFGIKISGTFIPTETGTYTFTIDADDGIDFTIENTTVVGYYGPHGLAVSPLGTYSGTYNMTAGVSYRFTVRMQEGAASEGLRFYWKPPSSSGAESGGYKKNFIQRPDELLSDRFFDGSSAVRAAPSARYIKNLTGTNTDGVYWINLPTVGPTQIYCLMNSVLDGGGWMMMMKATAGTTFQYSSAHWTTVSTLNPTDNTRNNGDAKYHTMNYYPAKDLLALFPDVSSTYGSSSTGGSINLLSSYNNWCWLENNFNNGIRVTPIFFWANTSRLYLGDATNFAGRGTVFSTQTDVRFYGFNYYNDGGSGAKVSSRWGFGWNENGGGLYPNGNMQSDDVSGGIGITSDRLGNYSAGDFIACCQSITGINRTARVEIYIR